MNIATVALAALALLALNNNGSSAPKGNAQSLKGILSDDTNSLLETIGTLNDKNASKEDKTGALLQVVTNPTVLNLAGNLFGSGLFDNKNDNANSAQDSQSAQSQYTSNNGDAQSTDNSARSHADTNDEGYDMGQYSEEARNFFRPVENIAGIEAAHKLYKLYDEWYSKKH